VPGSNIVKQQAEAEGLDKVFRDAGFQWRYAGCSMCLGTNGDQVGPGHAARRHRTATSSAAGPGSRTHLMSPAMAAAAALTGRLTDVRQLSRGK
jgi:3-isopropylmalate/(R)-2-methylmalate dehydratase large subunit